MAWHAEWREGAYSDERMAEAKSLAVRALALSTFAPLHRVGLAPIDMGVAAVTAFANAIVAARHSVRSE